MAAVRPIESGDRRQDSAADAANPGIHPVTDDVAIEQVAHKSEVLAVIDPSVAQVHLYPGVEDFGRREGIDEFRNDASLKRLVDCEPVQSAANSHATQQGH